MNNAVTGWRAFSNPRYFPEPYRRQKGWERIRNDNEPDNSMDGFQEIPTEEMEQLGLPEEWLKEKYKQVVASVVEPVVGLVVGQKSRKP